MKELINKYCPICGSQLERIEYQDDISIVEYHDNCTNATCMYWFSFEYGIKSGYLYKRCEKDLSKNDRKPRGVK